MLKGLLSFLRHSSSAVRRSRASKTRGARPQQEMLEKRHLMANVAAAAQPPVETQADQQFIAKVYHDFLNRAPDPAGLAYWEQFLAQQGAAASPAAAHAQMADTVMASAEYRNDVVTNIYRNFLQREPDPAGLEFWSNQLATSGESAVLTDILASPEYAALHGGTTSGLVNGLYIDLLGRAPDPTGQAYWVNQFGSTASGGGSQPLGLYNNATAARIQQLLNTNEGRLLLLNNAGGNSALSHLTGQGWNQLFFQGNLDTVAQNAFFANYQANPSFEMALQQLLGEGGFYQGSAAPAGNANGGAGSPVTAPGVGNVLPAGYPIPSMA
jgi:hypothetical protein